MTTASTPAAEKTTRELFLATAKTIIGEAVRNGSNMARIRALRNYMFEVLDGCTKEGADQLKAQLVGEMFSTHEEASKAIVAFAKEKAKYEGSDCGGAMAAIEKDHGIYSPTSEIWAHVAKTLTVSKKGQKDYVDLWRALRAELRSVADKANGQMNDILKEMGVKEKATGKKGFGKGKKDTPEAVASPVETAPEPITPDKMVAAVCDLDIPGQLDALKLLIEAMLISGVDHDQIAAVCETTLRRAYEVPAVAVPA